MDLLEEILKLDGRNSSHLSRILILLYTMGGRNRTNPINGITKLVKLDFLLRYPLYLEKALLTIGAKTEEIELLEHERKSVESSMIRYLYGPWDPRYRNFINQLIGKGLAKVDFEGRTILISLTSKGVEKTREFIQEDIFQDIVLRTKILNRHFKKYGATKLKNFIYDTFPEIVSLKLGEEIKYEF